MTGIGTDWRVIDGVGAAGFDAPSVVEGAANPAVLQHLSIVVESADPRPVRPFWQRVLD